MTDVTRRDRLQVLDCVAKQCRAIQKSGWEKDAQAVEHLATASDKLVNLYLEVHLYMLYLEVLGRGLSISAS